MRREFRDFSGINIKIENTEMDKNILNIMKINRNIAEENPMTNLLADALRDKLKCDIGLINSGVINGGIRKGEVSFKKLIQICPSPLNPTYMEIKGKYIKRSTTAVIRS